MHQIILTTIQVYSIKKVYIKSLDFGEPFLLQGNITFTRLLVYSDFLNIVVSTAKTYTI